MKLSSRSYPHPVVGNNDDVPGAAFQASLEMSADKQAIYIDTNIQCSSKTINGLLKKKDASWVLHVECSNTLFRKSFEFSDTSYRAQIAADVLNDSVEVNVFAKANRAFSGYRVDSSHTDYAGVQFDIEKGNILAVGEGRIFYIDSKFDALSPIGSIMDIHEALRDGDLPMRVDFNGQKIDIYLSKKDFADYKLLKVTEGVSLALSNVIVLPVLIEAIRQVREDPDDESRRWVRALKGKMEGMSLKLDGDPLENAQLLLELPLRRALGAALGHAQAGS